MYAAKHALRVAAADALESLLPYTSYSIDDAEYLGRFDGTRDELASRLSARGYHYQLFAATKTLGADGPKDVGSFARIPDRHPDAADGTALDEVPPGECQYHVHPFDVGDGMEVYGHYEVHPYPHTPHIDVSRPWPRHYRPTWDRPDEHDRDEWTYLRGVCDARLDPILER